MPDNIMDLITSPYLPGTGNPDTAFEVVSTIPGANSPYAPGDLGKMFAWGDKIYRKVILHSNAGVVAVGQLMYWQNKSQFIVTNRNTDALLGAVADSNRNNVAGIIRGVIPINAQFFMLVKGNGVRVLEGGAGAPGMLLVANTGGLANALGLAVGTAATHQTLGTITVATSAGSCTANFDVGIY